MQNVLIRMISTLTNASDISAALSTFARELGLYYQADRVCLIEYDPLRRTLTNSVEWHAANIANGQPLCPSIRHDMILHWNEFFLRHGDALILSSASDLIHSDADMQLLEAQHIKTLMVAPLRLDNSIAGILRIDNAHSQAKDTALLRSAADLINVALDKRRTLKHLDQVHYIDPLTGVQNRTCFTHALETIRHQPPRTLGVIHTDINGFDTLNETRGYDYGDNVLCNLATLLARHASHGLYRTGEDEFTILMPNLSKDVFDNTCRLIRHQVEQQPEYSVSVCCAYQPEGGNMEPSLLLEWVKRSMEAEKALFYRSIPQRSHLHKDAMEEELLAEIAAGHFLVHIQPQIELATGRICGAEALVRKRDSDGSLLSPNRFVPLYEAMGLQMHLDLFVLTSVVQAMAQMPADKRPASIAVNASRPLLLLPDLTERITRILDTYRLDPRHIKIEITENVAIMGHDRLKGILSSLKQAGVQVALDDFGTDYSNLSLLADVGFDEIKLDKCMIDPICTDQRSRIVLSSILEMCQRLNITHTLAEGIETPEQLTLLKKLKCRSGQGYLLYKPMPLADFITLMASAPQT